MTATLVEPHKSSKGNLDANIMVLIAYLAAGVLSFLPLIKYVAWLAPLLIYLTEKQSRFIRFHALQAFFLNAINFIISVLAGGILTAGFTAALVKAAATGDQVALVSAGASILIVGAITLTVSLVIQIFALIAMINGYQYKLFKIPLIGNLADQYSVLKR